MGNKKSKLVEKKYVRIQSTAAAPNRQEQSDETAEFLSRETQLKLHFERREAERKQLAVKSPETKPEWTFETDRARREADLRRYFEKKETDRTANKTASTAIDRTEQRNTRDVQNVLGTIKPGTYKAFCDLLQTHPFIQHWKVFEEAIDVDINWSGDLKSDKVAIAPDCQLFTLRLMDNDYQITEKELERIEMRLYLKARFRMLKRCILDHYLGGVKSLQELCRLSLKKFQHHNEQNYRDFVKNLVYPERLKDFSLQ